MFTHLAIASLLVWGLVAEAQTVRRLTFQSNKDKFTLVLSGSKATVDGKAASLSSLKELLPLLAQPLEHECDGPIGKPDLTVEENGQKRLILVKQGTISDGKNCVTISGDGLFYFPTHREFLIGPKKGNLELKNSVKLFRSGEKVLSLKRQGKIWLSDLDGNYPNWDFIERWLASLESYEVRLRVQDGIAAGKPKVIVQIGDKSYEFFKVTNQMWAVKKPGTNWLEASDDWGVWYDLDDKVLEDRYADSIRQLLREENEEQRYSALQKMDNSWSPNLRVLFHKILSQPQESERNQSLVLKYLRRKPALETAGVLVETLEKSGRDELRKEISLALRTQYPKGPKFDPSASEEEQQNVIRAWRTWWQQQQKAP
jgi:hypothetical protein